MSAGGRPLVEAGGAPHHIDQLRLGEMLAEGGEGRVYELPLRPHLVYKQYRRPLPRESLDELVSWPGRAVTDTAQAERLLGACAWPVDVVADERGRAAGILIPRAPRRFAVRHRDGTTRLASLSYLTADPVHRAVAYGLQLPAAASPERIGLVLALARLLELFDTGDPKVGHGDLSTKNVLWSLQRGPEIFVIDCDNCECFSADGEALGHAGRRRAMTPNWDDPAVVAGTNPSLYTDRYSLALIFLRLVGAANFPVQARQREGGVMTVEFAVPTAAFAADALGPASPVWGLCERGLSVERPEARPPAAQWVEVLDSLLTAGRRPPPVAGGGGSDGFASEPDVVIRPVRRDRPADSHARPPTRTSAAPPPTVPFLRPFVVPGSPLGASGPAPPLGSTGKSPLFAQLLRHVRQGVAIWLELHLNAVNLSLTPGRRGMSLRAWGLCLAVDVLVLILGFFLAAMIAAPVLGI